MLLRRITTSLTVSGRGRGMSDQDALTTVLQSHWAHASSTKVKKYIGKFQNRLRRGDLLSANVKGNHGTYRGQVPDVPGGSGARPDRVASPGRPVVACSAQAAFSQKSPLGG